MMKKSIGILGIGTYLPSDIRTNDWWPTEIVQRWREKRAAPLDERLRIDPATPGERAIAAAVAALRDDPFQGAVERRVMKEGTRASEMELDAARNALDAAGIDRREIGLVLCNSVAPDYHVTNNAALLHRNLELSASCMSLATEAGCNAFMVQLALAAAMIHSGTIGQALIVQSCNVTPLLRREDPLSAWFGDGCAAAVVGPVSDGRGILAQAHRTRGEFHRAIVASVPGRAWYDDGKVEMYSGDHAAARSSFLAIADYGKDVVGETLASAGVAPTDVDYYAAHQPSHWFRPVTQEQLGLTKARYVDTFSWTGSMFGANIPFGLELASKKGLVREGELVLMFAGGAGLTYSSMLLRWGT